MAKRKTAAQKARARAKRIGQQQRANRQAKLAQQRATRRASVRVSTTVGIIRSGLRPRLAGNRTAGQRTATRVGGRRGPAIAIQRIGGAARRGKKAAGRKSR